MDLKKINETITGYFPVKLFHRWALFRDICVTQRDPEKANGKTAQWGH